MFYKIFLSPQAKQKQKEKFLENQMHNILRLFNVLQNSLLTTSEAMGGYYLSTWYVRIAEQLKT